MDVIGGIAATVLGVLLGAILTGRSQNTSWIRDRQVEAYAAIIRESTRAQLGLRNQLQRRVHRVDWMPWNEALAMVSLVGSSDLVRLAQEMDAAFWRASRAVTYAEEISEQQWIDLRNPLEQTRLAFLNVARQIIAKEMSMVERVVSRPSLADLRRERPQPIEAD